MKGYLKLIHETEKKSILLKIFFLFKALRIRESKGKANKVGEKETKEKGEAREIQSEKEQRRKS